MTAPGRVQINGVTFVTTEVVDTASANLMVERVTVGSRPQRFRVEPEPGRLADMVVNPQLVWSAAAWVASES